GIPLAHVRGAPVSLQPHGDQPQACPVDARRPPVRRRREDCARRDGRRHGQHGAPEPATPRPRPPPRSRTWPHSRAASRAGRDSLRRRRPASTPRPVRALAARVGAPSAARRHQGRVHRVRRAPARGVEDGRVQGARCGDGEEGARLGPARAARARVDDRAQAARGTLCGTVGVLFRGRAEPAHGPQPPLIPAHPPTERVTQLDLLPLLAVLSPSPVQLCSLSAP
ncbi:uncharacterized protein RHOBADRAFT_67021, partial [Rhodotorula graminis WP1]